MSEQIIIKDESALALGFFDGLHKGHMKVIESAVSFKSAGLSPFVLLFDINPRCLIANECPSELLLPEKREELIKQAGAESLFLSFSEIMNMPPDVFFYEILLKKLNAKALCCGFDYRFGSGRKGDTALLHELCDENNIKLEVIEKVEYEGEAISSSRIRASIKNGNIFEANEMLGRKFSYKLTVVEGEKIGRLLGAPTLNQIFPDGFIVPEYGVYASEAFVDGIWRTSITNIGIRPTFKRDKLRSETYIIGYEGDLYGKNIEVRLIDFIRKEKKFENMDKLKLQIKADAEKAINII